jgi:hypothetical protein
MRSQPLKPATTRAFGRKKITFLKVRFFVWLVYFVVNALMTAEI